MTNAQRVTSSPNRDWLQTTAFHNPDGKLAVVEMNSSDKKQDFRLWFNGQAAPTTSQPHSMMTFVVDQARALVRYIDASLTGGGGPN